jgi:hypothetical protein
MPRYFHITEAEQLLPEIQEAMQDALELHGVYEESEEKIQQTARRITVMGGSMVNREEIAEMRSRRDKAATELNQAVEKVHSYGCQVKDLRMGLVDFPTLYRGQEVLLCWKLGEEGIRFWHGLEEGFRGRKAIDSEFLSNHRGDHRQ